jgi:hypothetical protein
LNRCGRRGAADKDFNDTILISIGWLRIMEVAISFGLDLDILAAESAALRAASPRSRRCPL